jgi:transposase
MRPKGNAAELERRRRRAVALLADGYSTADVAERVGTDPRSVRRWRQAYEEGGEEALMAVPPPGRPSKLSARHRRLVVRRLLKGAKANGFTTDVWTCPRIAEVIERHYGVRYHVDHIPRLMASLGWTCQKPEKRAVERDQDAISRWVSQDWVRIKKRRT